MADDEIPHIISSGVPDRDKVVAGVGLIIGEDLNHLQTRTVANYFFCQWAQIPDAIRAGELSVGQRRPPVRNWADCIMSRNQSAGEHVGLEHTNQDEARRSGMLVFNRIQ